MRPALRGTLLAGARLCALFSGLVLLACSVLASQAGEIAFESNRDGDWEIYLIDVQTSATYNLTRHPADDLSPSWSPDGSRISFTSDREPNRQDAYIMDANGADLRRVSTGQGIYRDSSWTADGKTLALMHGFGQLFLVDASSGEERWVALGFAPQLSPDGSTLLFYAEGSSPVNSHIFALDMATRRVSDLTPDPTHNWDAVWSPDSERIAFVSSRGGKSRIYVMRRDGNDLQALSSGPNDVSPAWSADGQQITYASEDSGAMRLFIMNADGSNQRALPAARGDNHAPAWRP